MPTITLIDLLATLMLMLGNVFILICAGSSGLALLFSFIRQRELFIRFWTSGLFVLLFAGPAFMAKLSHPDYGSYAMGVFSPMTNFVGGMLLVSATVSLMVALIVRSRFAYGILP